MKVETRLVQAGVGWDNRTGSISTPIYQTAIFRHPRLGESTGYDYSRSGNPTRGVLEETIAALEGGVRGFAFASGMAAIATLMYLFRAGDHLVVSDDLYGGTFRLFEQAYAPLGFRFTYVDTSDLRRVEAVVDERTRGLFIETPTNPLMKISDLRALSALARERGLVHVVDNTFMTPYLQRPHELGADVVLHSATKYLGGHNDLIAGLLTTNREDLADKLYFFQNAAGGILGPQDSWLLLRGMKTLAVRLHRQEENARALAQWLERHPAVEKVYYPGLPHHPGHELQRSQAEGFGGMISFTVVDAGLVPRILERVRVISFAESLGGVESLITYPATQTHADIPEEIREMRGITRRLLRLSVGIEALEDLMEDLDRALGA